MKKTNHKKAAKAARKRSRNNVPAKIIKERNIFSKTFLFMIIAFGLITAKDEKPVKKFTEKEKADLLKAVELQLKNSLTVSATNLYKVNLGFISLSRAKFLVYINNVIILMGPNHNYPTPAPSLATINGLILLEATTRSAKDYIDADIYMRQLQDLMRQLCVYIANTCLNNVVILRSVGVRENKLKGGPSVDAPPAEITDTRDTKRSGEAKCTVKEVEGMQGIQGQWMIVDEEGAQWQTGPFSTGISTTFTNLPKGKTVLLQIRFKSANGFGDWSVSKEWVVR